MNKNKLLKQASNVCSVFSFLLQAGIVVATIVLVHWHADKEFYRKVVVTEDGYVTFRILSAVENEEIAAPVSNVKSTETGHGSMSLTKFEHVSVYILYLQGVAKMFFLLLIVGEFGKVIQSVKALQTFRTENITSFRKIGKYFLVVFWFSIIEFMPKGDFAQVSLDFDITPLILMLAAYILAEIFKEGNRLYEEEQLTV